MSDQKIDQVALLQQIARDLGTLTSDVGTLKGDVGTLKGSVSAMRNELDSVKRTVNAIETMPVPYGRPKAFVSATEFHSVSNPVRVRQGTAG